MRIMFNDGNATNLARAIINVLPPILRDLLDALAFEKWLNLRRISKMEVKFRKGESPGNYCRLWIHGEYLREHG